MILTNCMWIKESLGQKKQLVLKFVRLWWSWIEKQRISFIGGMKNDREDLKWDQKSAWDLEKKVLKTYNIHMLYQQNQDLGILSTSKTQV